VRSAPCTWRRGARVSWLSLKTKVDGLSMVWPQNYWDSLLVVWSQNRWDCFLQFGLKTVGTVSSGLASKLVVMVSPGLASKPVVGFLVEPQNEGGGGFPGLCLKTGSYGLVIWASKSLRRFLGLGLKIKQATICRLRHKTDGRATSWDSRRDLAACFA
jgi:hypothetical protein